MFFLLLRSRRAAAAGVAKNFRHPNVATARHNLAKVLLLQDRAAEALPLVEQAWARRQRDDVLPDLRASTSFLLARVLWKARKDAATRARARGLAEAAIEGFAGAGKEEAARDVRAWMERPATWVPRRPAGASPPAGGAKR